jgi:hypothetical protein
MRHEIERLTRDRINLGPRPVMNPEATSPYQRYAKREYQYSARLREWERKIGAKHRNAANEEA